MWIFLPDSFISIVQKPGDAKANRLTVRGRIRGDIERVFPDAQVTEGAGTDYKFRTVVPREQVAQAMADAVRSIGYANFKGATKDKARHDAYMAVWSAMFRYQEQQAGRRR